MMTPSDPATKGLGTDPFIPMADIADIERDASIEVTPKKVVLLRGKLIAVPRRLPELGVSEIDLAGLGCVADDE